MEMVSAILPTPMLHMKSNNTDHSTSAAGSMIPDSSEISHGLLEEYHPTHGSETLTNGMHGMPVTSINSETISAKSQLIVNSENSDMLLGTSAAAPNFGTTSSNQPSSTSGSELPLRILKSETLSDGPSIASTANNLQEIPAVIPNPPISTVQNPVPLSGSSLTVNPKPSSPQTRPMCDIFRVEKEPQKEQVRSITVFLYKRMPKLY